MLVIGDFYEAEAGAMSGRSGFGATSADGIGKGTLGRTNRETF